MDENGITETPINGRIITTETPAARDVPSDLCDDVVALARHIQSLPDGEYNSRFRVSKTRRTRIEFEIARLEMIKRGR